MIDTTAITIRLSQVRAHLHSSRPTLPPHLAELLTPTARDRFDQLSAFDQAHLIAVASDLTAQGCAKPVITAGLLHDIAKVQPGTPIRLIDRVANAIIPAKAIESLLGQARLRTLTYGLAVLHRHATTGADLATAWGYPGYVAWLIRHHEDPSPADPDLALLIEADARCFAASTN